MDVAISSVNVHVYYKNNSYKFVILFNVYGSLGLNVFWFYFGVIL